MEELSIRITVIPSGSRDERSKVASHVLFHPTLSCRSSAEAKLTTWISHLLVFLRQPQFKPTALSLLAVTTVVVLTC